MAAVECANPMRTALDETRHLEAVQPGGVLPDDLGPFALGNPYTYAVQDLLSYDAVPHRASIVNYLWSKS